MTNTLVINLFGGPGCGKSTTMARLFADLKSRGYNVEMVSEFAKDLVYEQRQETMKDELYIFAKQHHRLFRVNDKVDVIITDRPLLLTNIYARLYLPDDEYRKDLIRLVRTTFQTFNNFNLYLNREGIEYKTEGRLQNLEQSKEIDELTLKELTMALASYTSRKTSNYEGILDDVLYVIESNLNYGE
jgi:nicotinamide riboside kinase